MIVSTAATETVNEVPVVAAGMASAGRKANADKAIAAAPAINNLLLSTCASLFLEGPSRLIREEIKIKMHLI
jgi:hypothetical protein